MFNCFIVLFHPDHHPLGGDGSVISWGANYFGGTDRFRGAQNVRHVYSTFNAFAALCEDGSVITCYGGNVLSTPAQSVEVQEQLQGDVIEICTTKLAFAALKVTLLYKTIEQQNNK